MVQMTVTPKISWRINKELHAATGLTEAFWRKMVQLRKIRAQEVEGAVVIMDDVLREFLTRKTKEGPQMETPNQSELETSY